MKERAFVYAVAAAVLAASCSGDDALSKEQGAQACAKFREAVEMQAQGLAGELLRDRIASAHGDAVLAAHADAAAWEPLRRDLERFSTDLEKGKRLPGSHPAC